MVSDLTILYITANQMPEGWVKFQLVHLLKSAGSYPIISVSRKPMQLGTNLIDNNPQCFWNIYMQMLRASNVATTPFVAMVEDDVLYTPEHFREFRPPMDKVSYDRSRWSLFTWKPLYSLRQRISNCSLIAPRELLIEALTERAEKHPNGCPDKITGEVGRELVEKNLGVTIRGMVEWYCSNPIVHLNHPTGSDKGDYGIINGRHMIKKHAQIKAIDIPYWGKAEDLVRRYTDGFPQISAG